MSHDHALSRTLSEPHRSSARASDTSAAHARLDAAAAALLEGAGAGAGAGGLPAGLGGMLGVPAGGEGEGDEAGAGAGAAGAGAGVRLLVLTALEPPVLQPTLNFSFICNREKTVDEARQHEQGLGCAHKRSGTTSGRAMVGRVPYHPHLRLGDGVAHPVDQLVHGHKLRGQQEGGAEHWRPAGATAVIAAAAVATSSRGCMQVSILFPCSAYEVQHPRVRCCVGAGSCHR